MISIGGVIHSIEGLCMGLEEPDRYPPLPAGAVDGGLSSRPTRGTALRISFLTLTIAFAAWAIIRNWAQLSQAWHRVEYGPIRRRGRTPDVECGPIAAALVCTVLGTVSAYPAWREILAGLGSRLPAVPGARVFLVGQLGKYVPGGVWAIVAQVTLARELQVPRSRSGTAGVLSILVGLITSAFLGAACLAIAGRQVLGEYAWALILATPVLALLHPAVLSSLARLASKITKRTIAIERLPGSQLLKATIIQTAGNVVLGIQFFFVVGTVSGEWPPILLAIGLFNLASAVGVLVPIAPAGVGVREVILVAGLGSLGSGAMDAGAALLIVLVSRVLSIVADFSLAGVASIGATFDVRSRRS